MATAPISCDSISPLTRITRVDYTVNNRRLLFQELQ
jgi:hypothetical protein